MLSVKELRRLAGSLPAREFKKQLGPFVLVQRPPPEQARHLDANELRATVTVKVADVSLSALSLLLEFEDLLVATLPPLGTADELRVGRLPDSDLIAEDGSVSKRHATLRWDAAADQCTVKDLGSTNGTLLNGSTIGDREAPLRDGDILSFGDVQFWYLLTETLHNKLGSQSAAKKLKARSG